MRIDVALKAYIVFINGSVQVKCTFIAEANVIKEVLIVNQTLSHLLRKLHSSGSFSLSSCTYCIL